MARESSPFPEEEELENQTSEEIISLLLLAVVLAQNKVVVSDFVSNTTFQSMQDSFRRKLSESVPNLNSVGQTSINYGLERFSNQYKIDGLEIDYSDSRFSNKVNSILNDNLTYILETNQNAFDEIIRIAQERGWSEEEIARRLKKYYGLTPRHINTVINYERALQAEGLSQKVITDRVQRRIDQLIEWRFSLIAEHISTGVVEGSKDESFGYLVDTSQIDPLEYVKIWRSVVDEDTTDTCLNLNNQTTEIGQPFPGGIMHPPSYPPVHECRSSIAITRRLI